MVDISSALADFNIGRFTVNANVIVLPGAIFAYHAPRYLDLGYSPIPAFKSSVYPAAWSDYCGAPPSAAQIEEWGKAFNSNIALACGYGGFVPLDVDVTQKDILAAVLGALPHCRIARHGSKGFALFCRHLDPDVAAGAKRFPSIYWADPNIKEPMIEIKASGQNLTAPPSVHRKTGKPYAWIDPETGATIIDPATGAPLLFPPPLAELPIITDEDIKRLRAALEPWARKPRVYQPKARKGGQRPGKGRLEAYARAGLDRQTAELRSLREGRPTALFKGVCGLGWAVHHGIISEREFADRFLEACNHNGLIGRDGRRAVEASIDSGLRKSEDDDLPELEDRAPPPEKKPKRKPPANGGNPPTQATKDVPAFSDIAIAEDRDDDDDSDKKPKPKEPVAYRFFNAAQLLETPAPRRKWAVEDVFPDCEVSLFAGDGGIGKSLLALQLSYASASGRQWLGFSVKHCAALYVSCEDDKDELHYRVQELYRAEPLAPDLHRFHMMEPESDPVMAEPEEKSKRMIATAFFEEIEALIVKHGIGVLVLDAVADVFGGEEISRAQTRSFIRLLRMRIARKLKCAVIVIGHPSVDAMKTGRGYSGSTGWNNSMRARAYLTRPETKNEDEDENGAIDEDVRVFKLPKTNRGKPGLEIRIRWQDGRFVRDNAGSAPGVTIEDGIEDETLFMRLLAKFKQEGRIVSHELGKNYAPTRFAEHTLGRSVSMSRFRQAMNNLLNVGKIVNDPIGPPSKRKDRLVRVEDITPAEGELPF